MCLVLPHILLEEMSVQMRCPVFKCFFLLKEFFVLGLTLRHIGMKATACDASILCRCWVVSWLLHFDPVKSRIMAQVLGPCYHMVDPDESPDFSLQLGPTLASAAIRGVNQQMEKCQCLFLSPSPKSPASLAA